MIDNHNKMEMRFWREDQELKVELNNLGKDIKNSLSFPLIRENTAIEEFHVENTLEDCLKLLLRTEPSAHARTARIFSKDKKEDENGS